MVVALFLMMGCGGSHGHEEDTGTGIDVGSTEAHEAGIPSDDAPMPSDDVPGVVRRVECAYSYGAECRVACEESPEVPIELSIDWSSPYCCADIPGPIDDRHFRDCRCIDGLIHCWSPYDVSAPTRVRSVPITWCDLCGIPGSRGFDAGTDAR